MEKGSYHKLLSSPASFDKYEYVGITSSTRDIEEAPPSAPDWVVRAEIPPPTQASR